MQLKKLRLLHESLRRYLRRGAWEHLDKLLQRTRDEEVAAVMALMPVEDQEAIFKRLPTAERQADVIVLMDAPFGQNVLSPLPAEEVAAILREMAQDDMADILADLNVELRSAVLEILEQSDSIEDLMRYGADTAGGIMIPEFVSLTEDDTVHEALVKLRESGDVEMVYYIYVLNSSGQLTGVLSLRKLVTAKPERRIGDIMESDVISVTPDTDQEVVARMVASYGFLSVPVVDDSHKMLGLVTVDDVIEVLREEATEDILKMAGAGDELVETSSVRRNVRIRFPWLLASCVGGLVGATVMSGYHETLEKHAVLAFYLPMILGMSGNVGTQTATVTVRALALGHIGALGNRLRVVRREVAIGLVMGLIYGLIVGVVASLLTGTATYGLAVGLAFVCGMIVASSIGAAIPMLLSRLSFDPAVATGPFVTTTVDILGIITYFGIARVLLSLLHGG
ncbi:MAG: magnesium transporter [Deltaproteobacteria bacterium]|nr:magnesium transporter [Deltaproteobacteria bacterium]MCB9787406.1 magnesium transporter [Deltaproteobacteria bacterium]